MGMTYVNHSAVRIANMINATQSALKSERRTEEITFNVSNPRIKVSKKAFYVVFIDSHKTVRRRGETKCVGIAAEICPKTVFKKSTPWDEKDCGYSYGNVVA